MPSPRRLSTTSRLWHPRPSIGSHRLDGFDGRRQGKGSHKQPGRGRGPTEEPDRQAERYEQDDVEAGVAKVEVMGERRQSDAPEIAPAWCRR